MDILKDKSYKQYDALSRYSPFPYYYNTRDKKYVYGTVTHLDNNTRYQLYEVKPNDTYDIIALKFYNNPTYFWVICDFNRIIDCFSSPEVGSKLKIPSLSNLVFE